ncbi:DNA invertase [Escherichia coli]|nr:DNA invertase [Escherichia coli]
MLRCISASLLAEWLKATEQAHQRVMLSLLPNQGFREPFSPCHPI